MKAKSAEEVKSSECEEKEMEEVDVERRLVDSTVGPILETSTDTNSNSESSPILSHAALVESREQLPSVIMHKLRKVYPSPGKGSSPTVAVSSFDLHVPVSAPYLRH